MKRIPIAILLVTSGYLLFHLGAWHGREQTRWDKPYEITLETVDKRDKEKCTSDENCMDILELEPAEWGSCTETEDCLPYGDCINGKCQPI